jgi:hypothetical protein
MNNSNSNSNNKDHVDEVVVVHMIPIMVSRRGVAPAVSLAIAFGVLCDDTTRHVADRHFREARWREMVEANAKHRGATVIPDD